MYDVEGRRRLTELELDWLPGYEGSKPVRIGNAASSQFQLDVYGELADALYHARTAGVEPDDDGLNMARALIDFVADHWADPDEGIWETRGGAKQFTHSKVMAWVAMDRSIRTWEELKLDAPLERWRMVRQAIHDDVCRRGFDAERGAFVQSYGSKALDASLLRIPLVGFLPAKDPRVVSTVAAIERELKVDGLVRRYQSTADADGLPAGEGTFFPCSFWLVDNLRLQGRRDEARELFEHLLTLGNDLGLFSEEYDAGRGRQVGNFPQAFTHVSLINSAFDLAGEAASPDDRDAR
jgi:GH15 family glucan-1,4-alpha-glucosidase